MSDPPKSTPTFSFGTTPTSGGSGAPGIFGQSTSNTKKTPASPFGSGSGTPAASSANLFGSFGGTAGASQPSSAFGKGGTVSGNSFGGTANSGSGFALNNSTTGTGQSSGFDFGKAPGSEASNSTTLFSSLATPNKPSDSSSSGQTPKTSLFGSALSAGGTSAFGNPASNPTSSSQAGNITPAATKTSGAFPFGNPSTTPAGPPPSGTTSAAPPFNFNKPQEQKSSLFKNQNAAQTSGKEDASTGAPSNSFTGFSQPASGGFFGFTKPAEASSAASAAQPSKNIFGPSTSSPGSNLFGSKASTQPGDGFFAKLSKPQDKSGDSSSTPNTGSTTPAIAATPQTQGQADAKSSNLFSATTGQNSNTTAATQASSNPLFGSLSTQPSSKPTFNLPSATPATSGQDAGAKNATSANGAPPNLFGILGGAAPSSAASSSATPAFGGLFSNLNKPADNAADTATKPSTNPTSSPSTSVASGPKPTLFGVTTTAAGSDAKPQPAKQGSTVTTAEGATASTTNLGTSTAGPAPPAQSRLKNKSMDEIITRWASDLSKYQKEFQAQAEKVAGWDRMLVENSEKIQKLYGSTLEAERATSEVERQLSAVESNQEELACWLDHYEAQVDQLMSQQLGQGEALQGPDQDRERTYKLAEKLSERLDEMGKDLASMIEEINDISTSLSKNTKADDPLSQIVRILNSHLSQLQQIDQGAAALQAKISAAQKSSKGIGSSNGFNGLGSSAADDFYRSYMGRR
ncbi:nucleoporin nsp1 [Lasallia pustulata]|uniref:Nucleoporin NSP1 n=1 Tax=Lasallia pustulata TaxID=136370 RepID=A0A1W5D1D0_9LECA|nr:nucleoporin nsp1 [Lasallia pustulata]